MTEIITHCTSVRRPASQPASQPVAMETEEAAKVAKETAYGTKTSLVRKVDYTRRSLSPDSGTPYTVCTLHSMHGAKREISQGQFRWTSPGSAHHNEGAAALCDTSKCHLVGTLRHTDTAGAKHLGDHSWYPPGLLPPGTTVKCIARCLNRVYGSHPV